MKIAVLLFMAGTMLAAGPPHEEIRLWPKGAPGSEGRSDPEKREEPTPERQFVRITNIHQPSITVYLPSAAKATGAAIVVAPGGGHRILAMHEGYDIGEWLASQGVAAFVLKYRLAREEGSPYQVDVHPVADAHRAIRLVRHRAKEWGVDPKRIGIMGFSAGGEVALLSANRAAAATAGDAADQERAKPDFLVLVYPGLRISQPSDITKDTPPAFIVFTHDDKLPAEAMPAFYTAMLKAGVPAEMHIYARGGHGYGIRNRPLPVSTWHHRLAEWLADSGFTKR